MSKRRRLEPLSTDRYGVHFSADGEFCQLLQRVRGLAGHRLPSGDLMSLFKRGLEAYERELEKERFALGRKPRPSRDVAVACAAQGGPMSGASSSSSSDLSTSDSNPKLATHPKRERRRHCPASVAREVFLRDGKQCSYVSPDGRRCGADRCLELDHVDPWAV
ncbi:MAG TPA: hypothetical protein VGC79_21830, partial [Polyangiaceae bacterium]